MRRCQLHLVMVLRREMLLVLVVLLLLEVVGLHGRRCGDIGVGMHHGKLGWHDVVVMSSGLEDCVNVLFYFLE